MESRGMLLKVSAVAATALALAAFALMVVAVASPVGTVPWVRAEIMINTLQQELADTQAGLADFMEWIKGRNVSEDDVNWRIDAAQRRIASLNERMQRGEVYSSWEYVESNLKTLCTRQEPVPPMPLSCGDLFELSWDGYINDERVVIIDAGKVSHFGLGISASVASALFAAVSGFVAYLRRRASEPPTEPSSGTLKKAGLVACALGVVAVALGISVLVLYARLFTQSVVFADYFQFCAGFYLCVAATVLCASATGVHVFAHVVGTRKPVENIGERVRMRTNTVYGSSKENVYVIDSDDLGTLTAQPGAIVRIVDNDTKPPATTGKHTYGLFDCCHAEESICACTFCAYPLMVAKAEGDLAQSNFDWLFCAVAACIFPCVSGWFLRLHVQSKYAIDQSMCATMGATCCCPACAAVQDIREANAHGDWDTRYGTVGSDGQITPNVYKTGLCDCADDPESCLAVCCGCHSCAMGSAAADAKPGKVFDFFLCCVACLCPAIGMLMLRLRVRRSLQLGDRWTDSVRSMCCAGPCAICQDIREVNGRRHPVQSDGGGFELRSASLRLSRHAPPQQRMTSSSTEALTVNIDVQPGSRPLSPTPAPVTRSRPSTTRPLYAPAPGVPVGYRDG